MTLKSDIQAWDGRSAAALCHIHETHRDDPGLALDLVELIGPLRCRMAATRLLKRHLEARIPLRDAHAVARELFARLDKLDHWECRLNILQCLPFLPIGEDRAAALARFLRACLTDENKFVRAWAYSGFHELASQHRRFAAEAAAMLDAGLRDEPASVKSRIRKCLAGSPHETPKEVLAKLWDEVGGDPEALSMVTLTGSEPVLPSSFMVGVLAQASIAAAGLAAAEIWRRRGGREQDIVVDMRHAALEFQSEKLFTLNGQPFAPHRDPLAGIHRCGDGNWIRPHLSFSHHRSGFLKVLGCAEDCTDVETFRAALQGWNSFDLEEAGARAGLPVTALRSFEAWDASPQGKAVAGQPLIGLEKIGDAPPVPLPSRGNRPLQGIRVLDLTRIIAGPVCGRVLAAHGADVLAVTARHLPFIAQFVIDNNRGKRTCNIDLSQERELFEGLLSQADVLVQNYRGGSLQGRGFGPGRAAEIRPGIVYAELTAYGEAGPWAGRRGFDSITQTACGFNAAEAAAAGQEEPKALPCQCLDHASGYLLALGIMTALMRRAEEGGSWRVRVSLARAGLWLRSLGRRMDGFDLPDFPPIADLYERRESGFGPMEHIRHAARLSLTPARWELPSMPIGSHAPGWMS
jgi:crotonobetainyl-CoA:carnitine CoA-transferase CaiB-like acyl-CoA transferase